MGTSGPLFIDLQTNGDHWENRKEFLNKLVRTDLIQEERIIESELILKMYRSGPQRRRKLFLTATAWELNTVILPKLQHDTDPKIDVVWVR